VDQFILTLLAGWFLAAFSVLVLVTVVSTQHFPAFFKNIYVMAAGALRAASAATAPLLDAVKPPLALAGATVAARIAASPLVGIVAAALACVAATVGGLVVADTFGIIRRPAFSLVMQVLPLHRSCMPLVCCLPLLQCEHSHGFPVSACHVFVVRRDYFFMYPWNTSLSVAHFLAAGEG